MNTQFKVNVQGRDKKFATLEAATAFCSEVFEKRGVVLSIVATTPAPTPAPTPAKSFNAEVIADASGQWVGNGLYFATRDEADRYGRDLMGRWIAVREIRSVECEHAVNYTFNAGAGLKAVA
jgi:hypothetical protein